MSSAVEPGAVVAHGSGSGRQHSGVDISDTTAPKAGDETPANAVAGDPPNDHADGSKPTSGKGPRVSKTPPTSADVVGRKPGAGGDALEDAADGDTSGTKAEVDSGDKVNAEDSHDETKSSSSSRTDGTPRAARPGSGQLKDELRDLQKKLASLSKKIEREDPQHREYRRATRRADDAVRLGLVQRAASVKSGSPDSRNSRSPDSKASRSTRSKSRSSTSSSSGWSSDTGDEFQKVDSNQRRITKTLARQLSKLRDENALMKKLRRENKRLEKEERSLRSRLKQLAASDDDDSASDTTEASAPAPHLEPRISWLPWGEFREHSPRGHDPLIHPPLSVINVLIGEPIVLWPSRLFSSRPGGRPVPFSHTAAVRPVVVGNEQLSRQALPPRQLVYAEQGPLPALETSPGQGPLPGHELPPGQGPLPERIRINSKALISTLSIVRKTPGPPGPPGLPGFVMVQPFRSLVYYGDQLRVRLTALEKAFPEGQEDGPETAESEGTPNVAESEGNPNDAESKGNPDDADADDTVKSAVTARSNDGSAAGAGASVVRPPGMDLLDDGETWSRASLSHLRVLVEFLDTVLQPKLDYLASSRCQKVRFEDIWYLFKPGDEVVEKSRRQAYRIHRIASIGHIAIPPWRNYDDSDQNFRTPVTLLCAYVDFDGKRLGPVLRTFEIERFEGTKAVTDLDVYPLRLADVDGDEQATRGSLRDELVARGRKFIEVAGVKHMHYNGLTLDTRDEIDSHVVVDFEEAFASKHNEDWRPTLEPLLSHAVFPPKPICTAPCCARDFVYWDRMVDQVRNDEYLVKVIPNNRTTEPPIWIRPRLLTDIVDLPVNPLTDKDFVIMSSRVFGFVLRTRKWGKPVTASLPVT